MEKWSGGQVFKVYDGCRTQPLWNKGAANLSDPFILQNSQKVSQEIDKQYLQISINTKKLQKFSYNFMELKLSGCLIIDVNAD